MRRAAHRRQGAAEIERAWIDACQIEAIAGDLRDALLRLGEFASARHSLKLR